MKFYHLEMATALFECLLVHVLFNGWYGFRNTKKSAVVLSYTLFFVLLCFLSLLLIQPFARSIIIFFLVAGLVRFLYDTTTFSALYSSLLCVALAVGAEYFCLALMNLLNYDTTTLMVEGTARAIYLVIAKTVNFAIILVVAAMFRKKRATLSIKQVLPLFPCLFVTIYVCAFLQEIYSRLEDSLSLPLVIAILGLLYINGIIVLHTQSIKRSAVAIQQQALANQQYELQVQYYNHILQDHEETRIIRHDIKKYMSGIETLIEAGASAEAKREYEAIKQGVDQLGEIVDIGNTVLNAILHNNIQRAKAEGISVRLDINVPSEVPASAVDLSVIIGNTFDNAIDECIACNSVGAAINVMLVFQNDMLFYEISNPCISHPHKKAGKYHGYGLRNIRACVEKYNGSMESGIEAEKYKVSIRLNCQSNIAVNTEAVST